MKYAKMLGLLAVAAAAMMAFAASASATVPTAPAGTVFTGEITATNEGPLTLHGPVDVTCQHSAVAGTVEKHGAGITTEGPISTLSFSQCNQHVTVIQNEKGRLIAHNIAGTNDATLTSTGARVTVLMTTIFGNIHCNYVTNNTHIGRLTAAPSNTTHATLDINSAPIPVGAGSSGLCGESALWTGNYTVTNPKGLRFS